MLTPRTTTNGEDDHISYLYVFMLFTYLSHQNIQSYGNKYVYYVHWFVICSLHLLHLFSKLNICLINPRLGEIVLSDKAAFCTLFIYYLDIRRISILVYYLDIRRFKCISFVGTAFFIVTTFA